MVLFNYSTKELTAKIVYYGPGLCGKTTNLQFIHENLPETVKGKMLSLATKTDRTLFFDFLPIDLGEIRGMKTRVQLYTVPGQVFYNETRKLVLKGADGIVFVADSQQQMRSANVESFRNLEENLKAHGLTLAEMPHVIQFNKRDLPKLSSIEELNAAINKYNAPFYESVATTGIGVQDSLKAITKLVLLHLTRKYDPKSAPAVAASAPARPAVVPAAAAASASATAAGTVRPGSIPVATMMPPGGMPTSVPLSPDPEVASVGATPSVPLADASDSVTPTPTHFGADEIDDLVDEVGETTDDAAPLAAAPMSGETDDLMDEIASDGPPPAFAEPSDLGAAFDEPVAHVEAAEEPTLDEQVSEPEGFATRFEVDHGVDPDWRASASPPAAAPPQVDEPTPAAPEPFDELELDAPPAASEKVEQASYPDAYSTPSIELSAESAGAESSVTDGVAEEAPLELDLDASPAESSVPAEPVSEEDFLTRVPGLDSYDDATAALDALRTDDDADVAPPDAAVTLTEVVEDSELFDDPSLEVARLAAGEEREIIVPVEVGDTDSGLQRYKLTVRLRVDRVES